MNPSPFGGSPFVVFVENVYSEWLPTILITGFNLLFFLDVSEFHTGGSIKNLIFPILSLKCHLFKSSSCSNNSGHSTGAFLCRSKDLIRVVFPYSSEVITLL